MASTSTISNLYSLYNQHNQLDNPLCRLVFSSCYHQPLYEVLLATTGVVWNKNSLTSVVEAFCCFMGRHDGPSEGIE
jgi:hypothetical protein